MTGVLVTFIIFVLFPGIILGFILISRYLRYRETQTMLEHGITPPPPQPMTPAEMLERRTGQWYGITPPPQPMPMQAPPVTPAPFAPPMQPMVPPMQPPMPAMPPMSPPMPPRPSRAQLTWGFVLIGVGLALTLALWPIGWIANSAAGESGVHFPLGLGPWMLAGFIPLFVGLALILAHVISQPERNGHGAPAPLFTHGVQHSPAPPAPLPSAYAAQEAPASASPAPATADAAVPNDAVADREEGPPPA